jgi:hypothetical protein
MRRGHHDYIEGEEDMFTSTLGFFLIRGGIVLFMLLFLIGLNFVVTLKEKKHETKGQHYHNVSNRTNPALS